MFSTLSKDLTQPVFESFDDFSSHVLAEDKTDTFSSVLKLSVRVDSLGQAFSLGYRCALQHLLPSLKQTQWAAFCVSETQGNHPKKIQASLQNNCISGQKSFVSMATLATQLIVIAKEGEVDDRPSLKAVLLDSSVEGLTVSTMPPLAIIPEIPHGKIDMISVKGDVLPGDGYSDYSRPFRTIEDIHLLTAFTGMLMSVVIRHKLNTTLIEKCLLILSSLRAVDRHSNPWKDLQINAAHSLFDEVVVEFEKNFDNLSSEFKQNWMRDKGLFSMAGKARNLKKEKALALI